MAETIALHLAAGAAAAPLQGGAPPPAPQPQHVLICEDEEYAFPSGTINGAKACTKCGATKTPQWREGPLGPKTLCNACGVKRTRKLRAEQEGAKRRKLSASPAPPRHAHYAKYPSRAAAAAYNDLPAALADSYHAGGSLEPELEAWGLLAPHQQHQQHGSRRPPRRAAEEAAYRTARYARTGEWDEGGDDAALRAATPTSSSDASLPSSSCPEEVSWPPLAGAGSAGGPDCYAAVNLMTMSAKHRAAGTAPAPSSPGGASSPALSARGCAPGLGAHRGAAAPPPPAGPAELEQLNHDGLLALAARYDGGAPPRHHKVAPVDLAELSACLPPAKVLELVRLNQELECAVHEAHAANAAVAAVAQVLASKQAAALRSREAAGAATKRLRRFMSELDTQFGIQGKLAGSAAAAARAPPSPAKPPALPSMAPLSPAAPLLAPLLPAAPALDGYPAP